MKPLHLALALVLASELGSLAAPDSLPDLKLTRWGSSEILTRDSFVSEVVVLDFFAYWCAPCRVASMRLHEEVEKAYHAQGGNRHGYPVRILSVNVEEDHPELTEAFIKELKLREVARDPGAVAMGLLGGKALPFLVVVDATAGKGVPPVVRYRTEGLDNLAALKAAIDESGVNAPLPGHQKSRSPVLELKTTSPIAQVVEAGVEVLSSSDIQVRSSELRYGITRPSTEISGSVNWQSYALEYEPDPQFDFLGFPERRTEDTYAGSLEVRQRLGAPLTLSVSGGIYEGYSDFRSLWIDNYYRQQFSFLPEYTEARPGGFSGASSLRWEYQPTTGFIELGVRYGNDTIPPGWDLPSPTPAVPVPVLEHGRGVLHTYATTLRFENVLSTRARVMNEIGVTVTSGRDPRYSYRGSLNLALSERWTGRLTGSYANEDPQLVAWQAGLALEYELVRNLWLGVSGRFYNDSGEIENSRLISTSAPALDTVQGGVGIRFAGRHHALKLFWATHVATYDQVDIGTRPFSNLYRDRTWSVLQAVWTLSF